MFKLTLIHFALVLLPFAAYILYLVAARKVELSRSATADALRHMPWLWLLGGGLILTAASLVSLSLTSGESPEGAYVPPRFEEGEIVPGHME